MLPEGKNLQLWRDKSIFRCCVAWVNRLFTLGDNDNDDDDDDDDDDDLMIIHNAALTACRAT